MMKQTVSLLFAMALAILPAACSSQPKSLWVKQDITQEGLTADGKTCFEEAKAAERGFRPSNSPISKGISDVNAFMAAHKACGARLGYKEVKLTAEDIAAAKKITSAGEDIEFRRALFLKRFGTQEQSASEPAPKEE